jgi:hypothetical protein
MIRADAVVSIPTGSEIETVSIVSHCNEIRKSMRKEGGERYSRNEDLYGKKQNLPLSIYNRITVRVMKREFLRTIR